MKGISFAIVAFKETFMLFSGFLAVLGQIISS
jgi:hypothetical protein